MLLSSLWRILILLLCSLSVYGGLLPLPWVSPGDPLGLPVIPQADYSFSSVLLFPPVGEPDTGKLDAVDPGLFLMTGNSANASTPQLWSLGTGAPGDVTTFGSLNENQSSANSLVPEAGTLVLISVAGLCCLPGARKRRNITVEYVGNTS